MSVRLDSRARHDRGRNDGSHVLSKVGSRLSKLATNSRTVLTALLPRGFTASQWLICSSSLTTGAWNVSYVYTNSDFSTTNFAVTRALAMHLAISVFWEETDISALYPWTANAGPSGAPTARANVASRSPSSPLSVTFILTTVLWIGAFLQL